jgi:hypothetical protein
VLDGLEHAAQLVADHVEPAEGRSLDLHQLLLEADAKLAFGFGGSHRAKHPSTRVAVVLPTRERLVNGRGTRVSVCIRFTA